MAGQVKFPLRMADGTQVRDMEGLQEHFDLVSVLSYYENGKLVNWLNDRYYEEEAEQIAALDSASADFKEQLCRVLGVECPVEEIIGICEVAERNKRMKQLRQFTSDDRILASIDRVAFSQEELADLLDKEMKLIYLCGEKFTIPAKSNVTYIGVNIPAPKVNIPKRYSDKGIVFKDLDLGIDCMILKIVGESNMPIPTHVLLSKIGFSEDDRGAALRLIKEHIERGDIVTVQSNRDVLLFHKNQFNQLANDVAEFLLNNGTRDTQQIYEHVGGKASTRGLYLELALRKLTSENTVIATYKGDPIDGEQVGEQFLYSHKNRPIICRTISLDDDWDDED